MASFDTTSSFPARRVSITIGACSALCLATWLTVGDPVIARAIIIGVVYLTLALSEITAPFVPTLLLLVATPLLLSSFGSKYALREVLSWPADPVLALSPVASHSVSLRGGTASIH